MMMTEKNVDKLMVKHLKTIFLLGVTFRLNKLSLTVRGQSNMDKRYPRKLLLVFFSSESEKKVKNKKDTKDVK